MLNVRLAGGRLYGKQLFIWLSLVLSLMASFYAVLFPTRCLGRTVNPVLRRHPWEASKLAAYDR